MKCAVVDIGSNTVRFSLYHVYDSGRFETLFTKKVMAGLAGYVENGVLNEDGINKACAILQDYQFLIRQVPVDILSVFATASLRNITNTLEVLDIVKRRTGIQIQVLSGKEEAELDYYGVISGYSFSDGLIFDIGGGSTELVKVKNSEMKQVESISIGSLNLFHNFISDIWPEKKELKIMKKQISSEMKKTICCDYKTDKICGIGGTVRAAARLLNHMQNNKKEKNHFPASDFLKLADKLAEGDTDLKKLVLKICPDRIHTIIPGIFIIREIIRQTSCSCIYISGYGVREGYLCKHILEPGFQNAKSIWKDEA